VLAVLVAIYGMAIKTESVPPALDDQRGFLWPPARANDAKQ
jgi:hypothetical protein